MVNEVYSFSIAAKINYHKLSGLKQHNFISQFWGSEILIGSYGAKNQGVDGAAFLLVGLGENLCPYLSQLLEAAHTPWLLEPHCSDLCFLSHILFSLTLTLLPSSYKNPCGYTGPTWIIQDNIPIPRPLIVSENIPFTM